MSLRLATFFVVVVLAVSTHATPFASRELLQDACTRACDAAGRTDPNTIQAIINEGNDICECRCNEDGGTPMHVAAKSLCHECIERLISPPANCSKNTRDDDGNTTMHVAAKCCLLGVVEELLEMGFPTTVENNAGETPLCCASRQDNSDCGQIVRQLIEAGADPCEECPDEQTPCEGCVNQGVCDVLEQDGACDCP